MNEEYKKVDDKTIEVTTTETKEVVRAYEIDFLKKQRESIQEQKDRDNAQRDLELAEVDTLIAESAKLGITEK